MPRQSKFGRKCTALLTQRVPESLLYQFEMLARAAHTRRSDIIAQVLMDSVNQKGSHLRQLPEGVSLADLWDERPAARFVKLLTFAPGLMTLAENQLLNRIASDDKYWKGPAPAPSPVWPPRRRPSDLNVEALQHDWDTLGSPSL